MTVRTRIQLLQAYALAQTPEQLRAVAQDALDTLQAVEGTEAFARARVTRLQEQVKRQAEIITGLERALGGK